MILPQHSRPALGVVSCVLFDMDGTLLDSAPGVTRSAAAALAAVGAPVPSERVLRGFVGPPMIQSFRSVAGLDEPTAQLALRRYRAAYAAQGAEQSRPYDGIAGLLQEIQRAGIPMAVATSKVEDQAVRLARRFGLAERFITVCGASDSEGRATKDEVIAEALSRLEALGTDVSKPVMVGDRSYDVAGAASHGIPTIFVSWGYGKVEEASGATAVADSPAALLPLLLANGCGSAGRSGGISRSTARSTSGATPGG